MTEALSDAVQKLRTLSPKLNAATDLATKAVARVEKFLNDECSIGLPAETRAWITETERVSLAYDRHESKFRILIRYEDPGSDEVRREVAWSEAPRGDKLATFAHLAKLLEEVAE